jgi:hypothetical protein
MSGRITSSYLPRLNVSRIRSAHPAILADHRLSATRAHQYPDINSHQHLSIAVLPRVWFPSNPENCYV